MQKIWSTTLLGGALAALLTLPAAAGEQYIDDSGHAVSGYDVVAYHSLPQSAIGEAQPEAVRGHSHITAEYNGATFAFASQSNRDLFLANPEKYVPAFDGHCAFGVSKGGKAPGNPHLWRIVDGRLYLNIKDSVVGMWTSDLDNNLAMAWDNWDDIESQPATDRDIPGWQSPGPLAASAAMKGK